MPLPNMKKALVRDLSDLGLCSGMTVMVHSSLGKVGWTVGGPATVIRTLLEVLGPQGTLVMPAESPYVSDPSGWNDERVKEEWHETIREHLPVFDPITTPTTMGAIPEAFRTYPGTVRSKHPMVSVCANGRLADEIIKEHSLEFCEGRGTPFQKLYDFDSQTLLLGVGFNRCTSLHYAESLVPHRRTTVHRYPMIIEGQRKWVENVDMANDDGFISLLSVKSFLLQKPPAVDVWERQIRCFSQLESSWTSRYPISPAHSTSRRVSRLSA